MRISALCAAVLAASVWTIPAADAAPAPAAAVRTQLQTAIFHSGELAQRGAAVAATRLHLQHTMNCLEGPRGPNFNPAAGYPCEGQGNGVIPDLQAAEAAGVPGAARARLFVSAAHRLIIAGIASNDVNESQPYAAVISRQLQLAQSALQ